jgi:hypothetical protein
MLIIWLLFALVLSRLVVERISFARRWSYAKDG